MAFPTSWFGRLTLLIGALAAAVCAAHEAAGQSTYILATGRRLPYLYAIGLEAAIDAANHNTPNAIVSRSKVALDRLDGQLLGDPANLIVSEDGATVYVVNHHGGIDNAEFTQHGGRGQIAVLDVDAVLDAGNDGTANALRRHLDSGAFGAVGVVLVADMLVIANAENNLTEDGGNRITLWTGARAVCAARWSWRWARRGLTARTTRCRTLRRTARRGVWGCWRRIPAGVVFRIPTVWRWAGPATGARMCFPPTGARTMCR